MVDAEPILYWMFLEVAPAGGAAIGGERVLVTTDKAVPKGSTRRKCMAGNLTQHLEPSRASLSNHGAFALGRMQP